MTTTIEEYENLLLPQIFEQIRRLAATKGAEYAHGDDRLDNFRRNGADCGVSMETCWRIYAGKHWDSITTYIKDIQTGTQREYSEDITGRALDLMVYLTLFICMVKERDQINTKHTEIATSSVGTGVDRLVPRMDTQVDDREYWKSRHEQFMGGSGDEVFD